MSVSALISDLITLRQRTKSKVAILYAEGLLSLEEFRLLSVDAFQRFLLQQGVQKSQLVRNSRHTWLYQGKGAHQVLQDIKTR